MPKISAPSLEEHRAETTDRLLDAWGELVIERGYAGVSLADVAARARLARTAIYTYFPDREALLFAWTDREVGRALEMLEGQLSKIPSYTEKLRQFVRLQLEEFTTRHLPPGQEVIQFLRPETYERFMQHIEPLEAMLRGILAGGANAGEFADMDASAMVPLVMACIGAERGPLATGIHDLEETTERVTGFLLRALGEKKPKRKKSGKLLPPPRG